MSDRASAMLVACHDCGQVHRVPSCRMVPPPSASAAAASWSATDRQASNMHWPSASPVLPCSVSPTSPADDPEARRPGTGDDDAAEGRHRALVQRDVGACRPGLAGGDPHSLLKLAGSVWVLGLARAGRLTRAQAPLPPRRAAASLGDDRGLPVGPHRRLGEAPRSRHPRARRRRCSPWSRSSWSWSGPKRRSSRTRSGRRSSRRRVPPLTRSRPGGEAVVACHACGQALRTAGLDRPRARQLPALRRGTPSPQAATASSAPGRS